MLDNYLFNIFGHNRSFGQGLKCPFCDDYTLHALGVTQPGPCWYCERCDKTFQPNPNISPDDPRILIEVLIKLEGNN